ADVAATHRHVEQRLRGTGRVLVAGVAADGDVGGEAHAGEHHLVARVTEAIAVVPAAQPERRALRWADEALLQRVVRGRPGCRGNAPVGSRRGVARARVDACG